MKKTKCCLLSVTDKLLLKITVLKDTLIEIDFVQPRGQNPSSKIYPLTENFDQVSETPYLIRVLKQLQEYFLGERRSFDLNIKPAHTAFLLAVQKEMIHVPYGQTISYSELAKRVGSPKAARAVGMACKNNHIPIIVPCHRIVGKNGKLTGFGGGLDIKQLLLDLEIKGKKIL